MLVTGLFPVFLLTVEMLALCCLAVFAVALSLFVDVAVVMLLVSVSVVDSGAPSCFVLWFPPVTLLLVAFLSCFCPGVFVFSWFLSVVAFLSSCLFCFSRFFGS